MRRGRMWLVAGTLLATAIVAAVGGLAFIHSGIYGISAEDPHTAPVRYLLTTLQKRSVARHASGIEPPNLEDADLIQRGLVLYREYCLVCHGAPGEPRERIGLGLNPNPPPLVQTAENWSTAEIYWIVRNGLKMAGMPAFGFGEAPGDLWAIVAFVQRMRWLSPDEYRRMAAAVNGRIPAGRNEWQKKVERDRARLRADGDAGRGAALIEALGCGTCHVVPGIDGARGKVGPPLTRFARRQYIAGALVNTPGNLVRWITDPQGIEPGTAMPDLSVTEAQALDIVAFLYTLQ